jgi:hypothetical protein
MSRDVIRVTMNPLLFADWGRMNRLFTKIMWALAAVMVCVVFAVLASAGPARRAVPSPHSATAASGAGAGGSMAASR